MRGEVPVVENVEEDDALRARESQHLAVGRERRVKDKRDGLAQECAQPWVELQDFEQGASRFGCGSGGAFVVGRHAPPDGGFLIVFERRERAGGQLARGGNLLLIFCVGRGLCFSFPCDGLARRRVGDAGERRGDARFVVGVAGAALGVEELQVGLLLSGLGLVG
jgi:hypothetical protein